MNPSLHSRRDDRGVVAIELVIVMPILLMLIIGTVVLGNFLNLKTQTSGLARDGARSAALSRSLPADTVVVGAPCANPSDPTQFVTVQATKNVTLRSIPLLPALLPDTITETVTMRCGG
jgi:Flp pilus assembly protein TadG